MASARLEVTIASLALVAMSLGGGCFGGDRWHEPGAGGPDPSPPPPATLAAPSSLTASAGDQAVQLAWTAVEHATEYRVYLATAPGVRKDTYASLPGGARLVTASPPCTVGGLENQATYYFTVTAYDGVRALESAESPEVDATPMSSGSTHPETGDATLQSSVTVTLHGSFTNPTGYTTTAWFEYGPTAAYGSTTAPEVHADLGTMPISAALTGLAPSTTFHFRLVNENGGGSYYGADRTFTTLANPEVVVGNLDAPVGLPFDGASLYAFEIYGGRLSRLDVTSLAYDVIATVPVGGNSAAIAIDPAHVYFWTGLAIQRADLDGANLVELLQLPETSMILPNESGIYVRHGNAISRVEPRRRDHHHPLHAHPDRVGGLRGRHARGRRLPLLVGLLPGDRHANGAHGRTSDHAGAGAPLLEPAPARRGDALRRG